ncbi:NAD(P)H-dependent oxidoreductase [bacterium]|jgi:NAD(P)H-dependent FMN reductase|nr:NAD(P)H-dependent oxidoreductase [bacterium]
MTIKLLAFSGSSRQGSLNARLLAAAVHVAKAQGAEVTVLDLRALALPIYDGDLEESSGLPAGCLALKQAFYEHHALLVASPEYNGFFSPLLKNAIDWASRPQEGKASPFAGKVAALLAASPGGLGGIRCLPSVRQLLSNLGVLVTPGQMSLPNASDAFAGNESLANVAQQQMLEKVVGDLLQTTQALQLGRC